MKISDVPPGYGFWYRFCIYMKMSDGLIYRLNDCRPILFLEDTEITALSGKIGCNADGVSYTTSLGKA